MPLPDAFQPLVREKAFWSRFFWDKDDDHEYPELEDCELRFPLGDRAHLVLGLEEMLSYFSLELEHPSLNERVELGWDDQAHWHPHVLRWEELDLIGRVTALGDPSLPHPGLAVALLHRFTPLTLTDDAAVIQPLLEAAYRSLGFKGQKLAEHVDRFDYRAAGFQWRELPSGWVLEQDESAPDASEIDLYTLRNPENDTFPHRAWNAAVSGLQQHYRSFAQQEWLTDPSLRELTEEAARTGKLDRVPELAVGLEEAGCGNAAILDALRAPASPVQAYWVLELLLDREPGSLIRPHGAVKRRKAKVIHRFRITVPGIPVRQVETPDHLCIGVAHELTKRLRPLSGRADISASTSTYGPDRRTTIESAMLIDCQAADDEDAAIRIIREVLRERGAPDSTRIQQVTRHEREIPYPEPA